MREPAALTAEQVRLLLVRPESFSYAGELPLYTTWSLSPALLQRESTGAEQIRFNRLVDSLTRKFGEGGVESGWDVVHSRHWVVGWVKQIAFRVLDNEGAQDTNVRFFWNRFYKTEEE